MNYLASPPLVVAYAIAGRIDIDPYKDPLAKDSHGNDVYLKDIWPTQDEIRRAIAENVTAEEFSAAYADVFAGDERWQSLAGHQPDLRLARFHLHPEPALFRRHEPGSRGCTGHPGRTLPGPARGLHHYRSHFPRGRHQARLPRRQVPDRNGVAQTDFNSLGSRRGNHEVMMRGTFANIRLRNLMAPGTEGGVTLHQPGGEQMSIYDAAMRYQADGVPAIVVAGKEYGSGSSRDWAAKGPRLLGVQGGHRRELRAHPPHQPGVHGRAAAAVHRRRERRIPGLTGYETYDIEGLDGGNAKEVTVKATAADGGAKTFQAKVRIDTPNEVDYYRNGGILHYVLRKLAA